MKVSSLRRFSAWASRNTSTTKAPDRCRLTLATSPTHPFNPFSMANGDSLPKEFSSSAAWMTKNLVNVEIEWLQILAVLSLEFDVDCSICSSTNRFGRCSSGF